MSDSRKQRQRRQAWPKYRGNNVDGHKWMMPHCPPGYSLILAGSVRERRMWRTIRRESRRWEHRYFQSHKQRQEAANNDWH